MIVTLDLLTMLGIFINWNLIFVRAMKDTILMKRY